MSIALADMTAHEPAGRKRRDKTGFGFIRARFTAPRERGADVCVIGVEAREGRRRIPSPAICVGLLRALEEEQRVRALRLVPSVLPRERVTREFADRLEHEEAPLVHLPEEALVEE